MGKVGALSVTSRSHTFDEHGDTYVSRSAGDFSLLVGEVNIAERVSVPLTKVEAHQNSLICKHSRLLRPKTQPKIRQPNRTRMLRNKTKINLAISR